MERLRHLSRSISQQVQIASIFIMNRLQYGSIRQNVTRILIILFCVSLVLLFTAWLITTMNNRPTTVDQSNVSLHLTRRKVLESMARDMWEFFDQSLWKRRSTNFQPIDINKDYFPYSGITTFYIMNLTTEYAEAQYLIASGLVPPLSVLSKGSQFETVLEIFGCEYFGSLLSSFALTKDAMFLKQVNTLLVGLNHKSIMKVDTEQIIITYLKSLMASRSNLFSSSNTSKLAYFHEPTLEYYVQNYLQTRRISSNKIKDYFQNLMDPLYLNMELNTHNYNQIHRKRSNLNSINYEGKLGAIFGLTSFALSRNASSSKMWIDMYRILAERCTANSRDYFREQLVGAKQLQSGDLDWHGYHEFVSGLSYSYLVLHRLTRNGIYQEWAWELTEHIRNVTQTIQKSANQTVVNRMKQPLLLSATYKFLYLTFDENLIPLDQWVFTEVGHPLPVL